jgi:hypothetical protein
MNVMDELTQIGAVEPPNEPVLEHAEYLFLKSIGAEYAHLVTTITERRDKAMGRHPRSKARAAVSVLLVGAVAAGVLLLVINGPSGASPAAASELSRLARISLHAAPVQSPGLGQYLYTKSIQANEDCYLDEPAYCFLAPETRQIWIASNESGRILETYGTPVFYTAQYEQNWKNAGSPSLTTPSDTHYGPGGLFRSSKIAGLSTDPSTLASQIFAGAFEGSPGSPVDELEQFGDLLRETDASPALRAACLSVIATISGVVLNRNATDAIGRHGVGFELPFEDLMIELIFDPKSAAFLGEKDWMTKAGTGGSAGWPAGSILNWTAYVAHGLVSNDSSGTSRPRRRWYP